MIANKKPSAVISGLCLFLHIVPTFLIIALSFHKYKGYCDGLNMCSGSYLAIGLGFLYLLVVWWILIKLKIYDIEGGED